MQQLGTLRTVVRLGNHPHASTTVRGTQLLLVLRQALLLFPCSRGQIKHVRVGEGGLLRMGTVRLGGKGVAAFGDPRPVYTGHG